MEFSEAKVLITVDGARRMGKTAPIKEAVDKVMGDVKSLEHIVVVKSTGAECGIGPPGGPGRLAVHTQCVVAVDDYGTDALTSSVRSAEPLAARG
jgi:acetyl-CoA synthetase